MNRTIEQIEAELEAAVAERKAAVEAWDVVSRSGGSRALAAAQRLYAARSRDDALRAELAAAQEAQR